MFFPPCPQSRDRLYGVFGAKGVPMPDLDYCPRAYCTSDRCGGRLVDARQWFKAQKGAWPLSEWGRYGPRGQYLYVCPECRKPVEPLAWPAYSAIDWSNPGVALGEREGRGLKPLAPATIARIERGIAKLRGSPGLVVPTKASWGTNRPELWPLPTESSGQDEAFVGNGAVVPLRSGRPRSSGLVEPVATFVANGSAQTLVTDGALGAFQVVAAGNTFEREGSTCRTRPLVGPLFTQHATEAFGFAHTPAVIEMRGGGSKMAGQKDVLEPLNGGPTATAWHDTTDPLGTFTAHDTTGLVVLPFVDQWRSEPARITDQLATIMTHLRHSLVVTDTDGAGPVTKEELEQVRFRMFSPEPEIKRGMTFADDYVLLGSSRDRVAGLGNAVVVVVAEWITERCIAVLRGDEPAA
ncbi:MAG: hypothetical protein M0Z69_15310 [Actinomycetota bacterium]|nr:hypothetical protein [Actinomycetota bacterium]